MKKTIVLFSALFLIAATLFGCSSTSEETQPSGSITSSSETAAREVETVSRESEVVEITERLFIAQSNDIYYNPEDYLGKTIKYEGIYKGIESRSYVIRYGPGCCGYDGEAGFEIAWKGQLPQEDDWCEVVGVLEKYEEDGWFYLRLNLSSLTVLDERGAEYVET